MKKYFLILFLLQVFFLQSKSFSKMPLTFFGITLGEKIENFTDNNCNPCSDGKSSFFNWYKITPSTPNENFISYKALTTPKSKLVSVIIFKGDFTYDDWQGNPKTSLRTCLSEQDTLIDALKNKYEKDYPHLTIKKTEGSLAILDMMEGGDSISISLSCKAVDPDPEWKFYKKEGTIFSSILFNKAESEAKDMSLKDTNTSGF